MPKNKYLIGTGLDLITARDFEMEVIDDGVDNSHVKDTINDYVINSNLYLGTSSVTMFNHVTYNMNGGTWIDTTLNEQSELRWDAGADNGQIYQAFITLKKSVYKPTNPTREGYKFLGWKSTSDIDKPDGTNSVHMDKYDFDEIDVNNYSGYVMGSIVYLTAQWEELVTKYEDEEGNELSPTEKGLKEDPKVIEGYKHIRTDKDEDGNITHVYKKNTLNPEIPREDEIPTPRPEDPGKDDTPTPTPDPKPEAPGEDGTPTPDLDPEEDDQNIIPGPGAESETDKDVDESDTSDDDNSTDKADDSTDESDTSDDDNSTDKTDDSTDKSDTSDDNNSTDNDDSTDESDTTDETETTDKSESTDKDDTPKKTSETDKKDTEDKTEIENEDSDISSDKVRVPRPSTTISSNNQVSSPARSSVVTRSSKKGASNNVQTGVSGAISVASILAAASAGLYASRKKKMKKNKIDF